MVVNFPTPVADDNCGGFSVSQTGGQLSGTQFTEGTHPIEFTVTDATGNTKTCNFNVIVNPPDPNLPPIFTNCPSIINLDSEPGICGAVATFPDLEAEDNENDEVTITRIDNGPSSGDVFPIGTTTLTFEANDGVNPPVTCSFDVVVIDAEDPVFTDCPADKTVQLNTGETSMVVNFPTPVADDNCGGFSVSQTGGQVSGTQFTEGTHPIEFTVTDAAGRTEICQFNVVVSPPGVNIPPSFTNCPSNINLNSGSLECGAVATFEDLETVDNENDVVTITRIDNGPSSGEIFPLGTTTVTFEANDGVNPPVTCSFDVTVTDLQKPVARCVSEFTLYLNEEGYGLLSAGILDDGSSDNCGVVEMTLDKTRFENADAGENTVTLTVTDASGNTDTCETIVTVVPYEPGVGVTCAQNITISLTEDGEFELKLTYTGNEENIDVVVSKSRYTCDDLGTQVITATYFGEFTGSCDINITVIDDTAPVVNCVSEIDVILDENGVAEISESDVNMGSTDNCGISRMRLSRNRFTKADIGRQIVQFTVNDASGNSDFCQVVVNVKPYIATTGDLSCVENLTLELDANGEVIVTAQDLYAGDPTGVEFFGELTFTCDDIGVNTITLSKKDDPSQSCDVEVEVVDNMDPVAVCLSDLEITLDRDGTANLSAQEFGAGSSDNCGIASMSLNRTSFSTADIGQQDVILTVTDSAGNTGTCQASVTILPNGELPPPVDCVDLYTLKLDENGRAQLRPEDLFSGGTSDGTYTVSKDTFTCSELGENTVTLTYVTPNEEGSCEIIVVVEDPEEHCEETAESGDGIIILYPNPSNGMVRFQTSPGLLILQYAGF